MPDTPPNPETPCSFCALCFAEETLPWCTNCGAGGSLIPVPVWARDAIRKNASWVGKRYYPAEEDREISAELKTLRGKMTSYPGRSVEPLSTGDGWWVKQVKADGTSVMTAYHTQTPQEALKQARTHLPYVEPPQSPELLTEPISAWARLNDPEEG